MNALPVSDDRRFAGRVALPPGSTCCTLRLNDGGHLAVPTVDVSELGVLVEVPISSIDAWPALNTMLSLSATFEQPARHRVDVECVAQVAWMGGGSRHGERHYRAGLRFVELSTEGRLALRNWLESAGVQTLTDPGADRR